MNIFDLLYSSVYIGFGESVYDKKGGLRIQGVESELMKRFAGSIVVAIFILIFLYCTLIMIDVVFFIEPLSRNKTNTRIILLIAVCIGSFYLFNVKRSKNIVNKISILDTKMQKRKRWVAIGTFIGMIFVHILISIIAIFPYFTLQLYICGSAGKGIRCTIESEQLHRYLHEIQLNSKKISIFSLFGSPDKRTPLSSSNLNSEVCYWYHERDNMYKTLRVEFKDHRVTGIDLSSNIEGEIPAFNFSLRNKIRKKITKKEDIISLLGNPTGRGILPSNYFNDTLGESSLKRLNMKPARSWSLYETQTLQGSKVNVKFLAILFDEQERVIDFEYSTWQEKA